MKLTYLIGAIFILIGVQSCNRPPEACIEISSNSAAVNTPITFKSCSKRALSQDWYFSGPANAPENDSAYSDLEFSHAFTVPGNYTVTLNAYSKFSFLGDVNSTSLDFIIQ